MEKEKNKYFNIWSFSLLLLFVLISVFFLFLIIPKTLLPGNTFAVYIDDGNYSDNENEIEIFQRDKNNEKLIHPLTKGSYSFAIYNNSQTRDVPYELTFVGGNIENIPLVFSLQKNEEYIFGGKETSQKRSIEEFVIEETNLKGRTTDIYKLEWVWDSKSDEMDTFIGNIKKDQFYNLVIKSKGISDVNRISKIDDNLYFEHIDLFKLIILIILLIILIYIIHIILVLITNRIKKRPFKLISKRVILIILVILVLINLLGVFKVMVLKEQVSTIFGYGGALVLTGSMEPTIKPGDLIIIKSQEDYSKGDIITYKGNNNSITHRIVDTTQNGYILTGDANNKEDGEISKDLILGKVIKIVPGFNNLINIIKNPIVIILFIAVLYFIYRFRFLVIPDKQIEMESNQDEVSIGKYFVYLIVLTIIVSTVSFSKYKTTEENINEAKIAKFDVEISHNEWSIDEYNDYIMLDEGDEHNFTFYVKNNSEVAVRLRMLNTEDDSVLDTDIYEVYDNDETLITVDSNGWIMLDPINQDRDEIIIEGIIEVIDDLNEIEFYFEYEQIQ